MWPAAGFGWQAAWCGQTINEVRSAMEVKLVVERGPARTRVVRLRNPVTTLGRQKSCGLRIPSGTVSRRHCVLRFQNDLLVVEDLRSANGTFLNGLRVTRPEVVRPGDRLEVGPLVFLVEYQLSQAAMDRLLHHGGSADPTDDFVEALPVAGDEVTPLPAQIVGEPEIIEGVVVLDEAEPLVIPDGDFQDLLTGLQDH
jgi:predicted component of type VI protein secretion system